MSSWGISLTVADMTWQQLHERMAFMADLIDRAAENPQAALDFNGSVPDVERLFGSEEGLLGDVEVGVDDAGHLPGDGVLGVVQAVEVGAAGDGR